MLLFQAREVAVKITSKCVCVCVCIIYNNNYYYICCVVIKGNGLPPMDANGKVIKTPLLHYNLSLYQVKVIHIVKWEYFINIILNPREYRKVIWMIGPKRNWFWEAY